MIEILPVLKRMEIKVPTSSRSHRSSAMALRRVAMVTVAMLELVSKQS